MTIIHQHYSPCDMTPSSSSACHIPAAWGLVCIAGDSANNQSTNSVPGAHLRTRRPDTFLSFRQVFWPAMETASRTTAKCSVRYHTNIWILGLVLVTRLRGKPRRYLRFVVQNTAGIDLCSYCVGDFVKFTFYSFSYNFGLGLNRDVVVDMTKWFQ